MADPLNCASLRNIWVDTYVLHEEKKNELRQVHPIIKKLTYLSEFVITKGSLSCSYYLLHAIMLKYKDILDNNKELKESASNSRIYMTSNSQGTEEVGK